jgi:ketosteroid isomerase-like protein
VGGRAEAVEEALKAFGQGDIDRFLEAFSDDVTWSGPKGENFPGAGNHDGRDAIREAFVRDVERSFASFGFRPDHFLGAPEEDIVVAVGAFTGEGVKGEGQLDAPAVQVWEFDGDEVVAVDIYTDSAAFPGVVTEEEQKEREQEQEQEEGDGDGKADGEGKGDAEGEGEGDGGAEAEGDGDGKRAPEAKADADGDGQGKQRDDDSRGGNGG